MHCIFKALLVYALFIFDIKCKLNEIFDNELKLMSLKNISKNSSNVFHISVPNENQFLSENNGKFFFYLIYKI